MEIQLPTSKEKRHNYGFAPTFGAGLSCREGFYVSDLDHYGGTFISTIPTPAPVSPSSTGCMACGEGFDVSSSCLVGFELTLVWTRQPLLLPLHGFEGP